MSKLGRRPIVLENGVEVKCDKQNVSVKGPKGTLIKTLPKGISLSVEKALIKVLSDGKVANEVYGLYRALLNNMVMGVTKGFEKKLTLIGVGYRVQAKGKNLDVKVGFSHETLVPIPEGVKVQIENSTEVIISGIDKQVVGQFASDVRAVKKPEPYKGKGIRYKDEYVRKKAGKAAAKGK